MLGNSLAIKSVITFKKKLAMPSFVASSHKAKSPISVPVKSKLVWISMGTMVGQPVVLSVTLIKTV